jgi:hypothetical protein
MRLSADMADVSVLIGLLLIGISLFMAYGAAGVIGYVGGVMVAFGLIVALRDGRK